MIELPFGEFGRSQQFSRVPVQAGRVDKALAVRQAGAYGHADPESAPLEREEPDDRRAVGQHGQPGIGAETIDGDRELRAQKRVSQRARLALHGMPAGNFFWAELARPDDARSARGFSRVPVRLRRSRHDPDVGQRARPFPAP